MKRYNLFLLLFLLLSLFSSYGFAEKAPTIIDVPFYLNGTQVGSVDMAVDKVDEEHLVCSSVIQILKPLLNKEGQRTLAQITKGKRYLLLILTTMISFSVMILRDKWSSSFCLLNT